MTGTDPQIDDLVCAQEEQAPAVLTVDELAELLRVERKTVYSAIGRGEIPGVQRVGRTIRIGRAAVVSWLSSGQGCVSRSKRRSR